MKKYPTIYKDKKGTVETFIYNSFSETGTNCLTMEIDGVRFKGSSFDDFELIKSPDYEDSQLKRFTFNKEPILQSQEFVKVLCNCSLGVYIPQVIFDNKNEEEIEATLHMELFLGKPSSNGGLTKILAKFSLQFNHLKFTGTSDYFEFALLQMQKEMLPKYRFKNCFTCHYSDYSPLGNGFFGSMLCYRENKVPYLTAANKEDFFKLAGQGFISVQETYCCDQFMPREKDTGYRGWPFDGFLFIES